MTSVIYCRNSLQAYRERERVGQVGQVATEQMREVTAGVLIGWGSQAMRKGGKARGHLV